MAGGNKKAQSKNPLTEKQGPSQATIVGIIVVVAFAVLVGFGVFYNSRALDVLVPQNATVEQIATGNADAPAKIDIYLDFQCPACKQLQAMSGQTIDELRDSGQAQVNYRPIAILDGSSPDHYSSRAAAAAGCVTEAGVFPQWEKLMYQNQPQEGSPGLTTARMAQLAQQAGAPAGIAQCMDDKRFAPWSEQITREALKAGVQSTPTVMVNGKQVERPTPDAIRQAVAAG